MSAAERAELAEALAKPTELKLTIDNKPTLAEMDNRERLAVLCGPDLMFN